ncbi:hypothetical protein ACLOJK_021625 [Asimina triloba]
MKNSWLDTWQKRMDEIGECGSRSHGKGARATLPKAYTALTLVPVGQARPAQPPEMDGGPSDDVKCPGKCHACVPIDIDITTMTSGRDEDDIINLNDQESSGKVQ